MKAKAMIVAAQAEAAEAGASMLQAGGNAVDAAIACALVQGVVDPLMTGIAGFGSAGIYFPGKGFHKYLDFHAPSPAAARASRAKRATAMASFSRARSTTSVISRLACLHR
jgi:gamma-glutamyltranspeptidase/glutathione hydrolase